MYMPVRNFVSAARLEQVNALVLSGARVAGL